jgi:bifunctional enzyme CysN/CysC
MSYQSELIGTNINEYLAQHERKQLLRVLTCGSVDDGKSSLIGRLLYDSKIVYEDQLAAVTKDSVKFGTTGDVADLALLVDGLQAEREQGITIDVAYRYFSTARRKFIIADTPGHEQYTRNMATGASTCDLAIILVDARNGVLTQTKRHSSIVSLLGIMHLIVAVNKMDLVDYSETVFEKICGDYMKFLGRLAHRDVRFVPISALKGDNVVNRSERMEWYTGEPLMNLLETIEIVDDYNFEDVRFPVQYVNRPDATFRGYSGTMAAGVLRPGDPVVALPSRKTSRVKSIRTYKSELDEAFPLEAVTVTLEDEIDVSRGDMLVRPGNLPMVDTRFSANIVWMAETPLTPGKQYYLKQTTKDVSGTIAQIHYRIDVNTLERHAASELRLNEIGLCEVSLSAPLVFDPYTRCKGTGAFIVIDRLTNATLGAGMILGEAGETGESGRVSGQERASRFGQKAVTVWMTGAGAREMACRLERKLFDMGHASAVLEEDVPAENAVLVASNLNRAGLICLALGHRPEGTDPETHWTVNVEGREVAELVQVLRQKGAL